MARDAHQAVKRPKGSRHYHICCNFSLSAPQCHERFDGFFKEMNEDYKAWLNYIHQIVDAKVKKRRI